MWKEDFTVKVRSSVKPICEKCKVIKRKGIVRVICENPKHCLCLCLGFSQIILMLPFLLMTLHFSQIGLTDDLTFTAKASFQTSSVAIIAQPFLSTQGKFYKIYKEYFVHIFLLFLFISPNDSSLC